MENNMENTIHMIVGAATASIKNIIEKSISQYNASYRNTALKLVEINDFGDDCTKCRLDNRIKMFTKCKYSIYNMYWNVDNLISKMKILTINQIVTICEMALRDLAAIDRAGIECKCSRDQPAAENEPAAGIRFAIIDEAEVGNNIDIEAVRKIIKPVTGGEEKPDVDDLIKENTDLKEKIKYLNIMRKVHADINNMQYEINEDGKHSSRIGKFVVHYCYYPDGHSLEVSYSSIKFDEDRFHKRQYRGGYEDITYYRRFNTNYDGDLWSLEGDEDTTILSRCCLLGHFGIEILLGKTCPFQYIMLHDTWENDIENIPPWFDN